VFRLAGLMKFHRMLVASALLCFGAVAHAQGWSPQRNVEIIVPSAPGGTNDKLARAVERTLITGKLVNSTVSIVHRAGAGNQIAAVYLGQHPGDPHYLMIGTPTLLGGYITGSSKLSHADFTPIASIFNDYMVFAANAASPVKTGKDLIARMRTEAQAMPLGFSSALGNHHHIAAGLFMKGIGAAVRDLKPVVFKGSAEAIIAVLGGHIELVSTGAINAAPHVASGKLRAVGISSGQRLPGTMAVVPTWKEQGVDLVYGSWRNMIGPKGLAPEHIAYWESALRKVTETAEWKAELERNYWSDYYLTGPALAKSLDKEHADMKGVLVELGLARQ
jgi:putative tricarboxylic transport membrane protein